MRWGLTIVPEKGTVGPLKRELVRSNGATPPVLPSTPSAAHWASQTTTLTLDAAVEAVLRGYYDLARGMDFYEFAPYGVRGGSWSSRTTIRRDTVSDGVSGYDGSGYGQNDASTIWHRHEQVTVRTSAGDFVRDDTSDNVDRTRRSFHDVRHSSTETIELASTLAPLTLRTDNGWCPQY